MIKIVSRNETSVPFEVHSEIFSESISPESSEGSEILWSPSTPDSSELPSNFSGLLGSFSLPHDAFSSEDKQIFLTLYFRSKESPDDGKSKSSLALRLKLVKGLIKFRVSYMVLSLPNSRLMPLSSWHSGARKNELYWLAGNHSTYKVVVSKRRSTKFIFEIHPDASEDPLRQLEKAVLEKLSVNEKIEFEEVYENERKNSRFGRPEFSKGALGLFDRPAWTDFTGKYKAKPDLIPLPSPCWRWIGEWKVDVIDGITDQEGWMYSSRWGSSTWQPETSFGRILRRRKWIRFRQEMALDQPTPSKTESHTAVKTERRPKRDSIIESHRIDAISTFNVIHDSSIERTVDLYLAQEPRLKFTKFKTALFDIFKENFSQKENEQCINRLGQLSPRFLRETKTEMS